jgi:hypothetical protein
MVQKPRNSASALEIASLLDLLNSSEADDRSDSEPAGGTTSASPDPLETSSPVELTLTTAKPVDLSVDPENSDNRFAAHIVFGFVKIEAQLDSDI